ncbi:FXSXX-COOH protein [Streptomyces gilvus]|uniref:FXSXX-COOH protein n=1 Tax=Streptomyces gilvus TaxID=2920937 RepID=UPI001F10DE71|nr:FXSXX-COOH protein [Streptomyces sp. CME 23]MCH5672688.1 FXSXX-COOH protein [Streptomyces sp. CME 23]
MSTSTPASAEEPGKPSTAGPERVPLVRLAARRDGIAAGALTRVVAHGAPERGPARVSVAAFQSAV